jgi:hypothetical protein
LPIASGGRFCAKPILGTISVGFLGNKKYALKMTIVAHTMPIIGVRVIWGENLKPVQEVLHIFGLRGYIVKR